jgi:hypothetical protein
MQKLLTSATLLFAQFAGHADHGDFRYPPARLGALAVLLLVALMVAFELTGWRHSA